MSAQHRHGLPIVRRPVRGLLRFRRTHVRLAPVSGPESSPNASGEPQLRVIAIDPAQPRDDRLAEPIEALRAGEIVALPTETFYGLAVDATNEEALVRLKRLKQKPDDSRVLLLLSDAEQVDAVAERVPAVFADLARRFWPGPLTLVVPARDELPRAVTCGSGTVAVRVPGLPLPRRLAQGLGGAISGVSANITDRTPCRTAPEVVETFPEGLGVVLDGGRSPGGAPSTIVDLTAEHPKLVREGLLPASSLGSFLPGLAGA
ncbi:MAG: threonylcarbamoyl-AMP synthase [bacterium]|nr:threonylcarbamoyl-AMP synthase [bacterium]